MSVTQRQQQIMKLLEEHVFCTVDFLAGRTYTSPSSIRRDLAQMETQGLVHRTHGGVSLNEPGARTPSLQNRLS